MHQFVFEGRGKGSAFYKENMSALIFNLQSEAMSISQWNQDPTKVIANLEKIYYNSTKSINYMQAGIPKEKE